MSDSQRRVLLLVNLGTPDSCDVSGVRKFLGAFLSDPHVVSLPRWLWLPILYCFVLSFRPYRVVKLYKTIWTKQGSPLKKFTQALAKAIESLQTDDGLVVDYAMSYSNPRLTEVLSRYKNADIAQIIILPLYPQYSTTTTESVFDEVKTTLATSIKSVQFHCVHDYHDHPVYIHAMASHIRDYFVVGKTRLLFSFHGLPQSVIAAGDPYAEQCTKTAELLAKALNLKKDQWGYAYQSRFGFAKWLQPATYAVLDDWASKGLSSVAVFCPGFATDCLETLEEIALGGADVFNAAGGTEFSFIPCLNDREIHAQAIATIAREYFDRQ